MNIYPDCFPCFFRQTRIALDQSGIADEEQIGILKEVAEIIIKADLSGSPAHVTTFIHRMIREVAGKDPFRDIKSEYNRKALSLYDDLKKTIKESGDPLLTAGRLAIAGNIIDFGIFRSVDMEGTIGKAMGSDIAVDDYRLLLDDMRNAGEILYLLDNAGEIVFDRLFIEELRKSGAGVTAVVKGSPTINDATIDDAIQTGLDKVCRVIDNGSDAVGTILKWCSEDFVRKFSGAALIVSKGQANFETLLAVVDRPLYFLFQAKCNVVARFLGLEKGSMIFSRVDTFAPKSREVESPGRITR
jgi:uncharacterized protein with ATP-grasp and redox domains